MKRALLIIISAIVLMSFTACGQSTSPITPDQGNVERTVTYIPDDYCGQLCITDLMVGQNSDLGDITVSIDKEYLYFDVELSPAAIADGWQIVETHADVYESLDEFPLTKKGNPKVGQYAYDIDSAVIKAWDVGTLLYISVHAALQRVVDGEVVQEETGWGYGEEFEGKSWAMYFMYYVPDCWKNPPLPDAGEYVDLWIYPNEIDCYTDVHLTGVPSAPEGEDPYKVEDGTWPGWCADFFHVIYYQPNGQYWYYDFQMYSFYDSSAWPTGLQTFMNTHGPDSDGDGNPGPVEWDKINWILNNKGTYTAEQVQNAIWWFTNGGESGTNNSGEPAPQSPNALAQEANLYGDGFIPGPGELMALILYKSGTQVIFIEVDP